MIIDGDSAAAREGTQVGVRSPGILYRGDEVLGLQILCKALIEKI
jgi:hypothetical protein